MLQILQNQSVLTMTSREIADLVQSRHTDVIKSIDNLFDKGVLSRCTAKPYTHPQNGQQYKEYFLSKRDSYIIVAQFSPEFTATLVDRWQELEDKQLQQFQIPQNFAEALRLAADQQETIQTQAAQIEAQKPAVLFVERYVHSTGNMGFRQVAKLLSIKENDFRAFLQDNSIMYKLGGDWVPYAQHINAGRFVTKTGTADNDHTFNSAKFTPKGVEWIADLLNSQAVE